MDTAALKQYVYENDYVEQILLEIGCHHITHTSRYWQCANRDGDNTKAIVIYKDESLLCINYTRRMTDTERTTDIIDLVVYETNTDFISAIKLICKICDIEVYHDFIEEMPKSLQIVKMIKEMEQKDEDEEDTKINIIGRRVVDYYGHYISDKFATDHIGYLTQIEFGLGYDHETNRITIPIQSEFGDVIGIKGRLLQESADEPKYIYLERCPKGCVLYGLNKTIDYIKESGCVYVFEAEKSVMQCWDFGVKNTVATGGKTISKTQIEMLTRLCAKIVFCFDQDVGEEEIERIAKAFPVGVPIYAKLDKKGILKAKASPSDEEATFRSLPIERIT